MLGAIFLFRIMNTGDDQIKMDASMGDFSTVTPLIMLAILILTIAVFVTIILSLRSLAADTKKIKKISNNDRYFYSYNSSKFWNI